LGIGSWSNEEWGAAVAVLASGWRFRWWLPIGLPWRGDVMSILDRSWFRGEGDGREPSCPLCARYRHAGHGDDCPWAWVAKLEKAANGVAKATNLDGSLAVGLLTFAKRIRSLRSVLDAERNESA
jgi:hypothetical protein